MSSFHFDKLDRSILAANALDHFDTSMYGFLAPILAPEFFPHHDPIIQIILAYSLLASSIITRPLGSWLFGMLAKKKGPIIGLSYSLLGLSVFTLCFALLPAYEHIGIYAPIFLILCRMARGIFAAGESCIAKIYLVSKSSYVPAFKSSYWYQLSSMAGILAASFLSIHLSWRACFISGSSIGFFAFILRKSAQKYHVYSEDYASPVLQSLWKEKKYIFSVALITGISYITYALPFIIINSLVSLSFSVSYENMLSLNTFLLIFDICLLISLGPLLQKYKIRSIIKVALIMLIIGVFQLNFLSSAPLFLSIAIRCWIVFWGVILAIPINLYCKQLFAQTSNQYFFVGISSALGASIIGKTSPAVCLWLFHNTHTISSISLYIGILLLSGLFVLRLCDKRTT